MIILATARVDENKRASVISHALSFSSLSIFFLLCLIQDTTGLIPMAAASVMLLRYSATSLTAPPGPVSCQRRGRWKERAGLVNPSGSVQKKGDSRSAYIAQN